MNLEKLEKHKKEMITRLQIRDGQLFDVVAPFFNHLFGRKI